MTHQKTRFLRAALVGGLLSLAPLAAGAQTFEFTAGGVGGVWYTTAAGISGLVQEMSPDIVLKTVPGGGVSNPSKLNAGDSQLGLVQSIFAVAAVNGTGPFEGKPHKNLRLVAQGLANNYLHFVRAKNVTNGLDDVLASDKADVGISKAGSTDEYSFRFVMDYYKTSYDDLRDKGFKLVNADYLDLSSAFKDRQIDYFFVLLGLPGSMIIDASQGRDATLVAFPEDLREFMAETYGYTLGDIPAGTYPALQDGDVATLITSTSLYASADAGADTIYEIVKQICENSSRLPDIHKSLSGFDCANAVGDGTVPLHAGAQRYYKEQGLI